MTSFAPKQAERAAPIFVLSPPHGLGGHVAAMLGRNPGAYAVPETNIFFTQSVYSLVRELTGVMSPRLHGLLRALAHLLTGEQSQASIELARRWLMDRMHLPAYQLFDFLRDKVAPLALVDRLTGILNNPDQMAYVHAHYPNARFVHVLRHPRSFCTDVMALGKGAIAQLTGSYDEATQPQVLDPQYLWLETHQTILRFLQDVDPGHQHQLRFEDVLTQRRETLHGLCHGAGLPSSVQAMSRMIHPERSPFAGAGPLGAVFGDDPEFIKSPGLPQPDAPATLPGPLPWRPDGEHFCTDLRKLAEEFGYS